MYPGLYESSHLMFEVPGESAMSATQENLRLKQTLDATGSFHYKPA